MPPKITLLATGGTIASLQTPSGLAPAMRAEDLLAACPKLRGLCDITARDVFSLDSSNIQPEEWQILAQAIRDAALSCEGIVITHGTDTMAYTSSALSFMLQNLQKPVVITGSQLPIDHLLTDARNNLYAAFSAVDNDVRGVTIAFDHKIINGCRAVKVRTMGFEAFESVNAPYVGEIYVDGIHLNRFSPPVPKLPTVLKEKMCSDVFLLKLIPGTNPDIFKMLRNMHYRGIVLETFGAGGMHFLRRNLLPELRLLTEAGISVVACSQCLYESSDFSIYEVGTRLLDVGVIPAHDMTTEAVVTKLMWALGQTEDPKEIYRIFTTNYAGEITL